MVRLIVNIMLTVASAEDDEASLLQQLRSAAQVDRHLFGDGITREKGSCKGESSSPVATYQKNFANDRNDAYEQQCRDQCVEDAECIGYTFWRTGSDPNNCFLHAPTRTSLPTGLSGWVWKDQSGGATAITHGSGDSRAWCGFKASVAPTPLTPTPLTPTPLTPTPLTPTPLTPTPPTPAMPATLQTCRGCPSRGGCSAVTNAAATAEVQCCDLFGSSCARPGCVKAATWLEATETCAQDGKRLCHPDEFEKCCGKGCMGDFGNMWADTAAVVPKRNPDDYRLYQLPHNTWVGGPGWTRVADSAVKCGDLCRNQHGCAGWSWMQTAKQCQLGQSLDSLSARGGVISGGVTTDIALESSILHMPSPPPPSDCLIRVNHHRERYGITPAIQELWHMHPCANGQSVFDKKNGAHKSFKKCIPYGAQGSGGGSSCTNVIDAFHNERWTCFYKQVPVADTPIDQIAGTEGECKQACNDNVKCKSFTHQDTACKLYAIQNLPYDIPVNGVGVCEAEHLVGKFIGRWYGAFDKGSEEVTDSGACCTLCDQTDGCNWFTYEDGRCLMRSRLDVKFTSKSTNPTSGSPYVSSYTSGAKACSMGPRSACQGHCGPIAGEDAHKHEYMSYGESNGLFTLNWHRNQQNPWCDAEYCPFSPSGDDYESTPQVDTR